MLREACSTVERGRRARGWIWLRPFLTRWSCRRRSSSLRCRSSYRESINTLPKPMTQSCARPDIPSPLPAWKRVYASTLPDTTCRVRGKFLPRHTPNGVCWLSYAKSEEDQGHLSGDVRSADERASGFNCARVQDCRRAGSWGTPQLGAGKFGDGEDAVY